MSVYTRKVLTKLPSGYYRAIGQIVEKFGSLESTLVDLIHELTRATPPTRVNDFDDRVMALMAGEEIGTLIRKLDKLLIFCLSDKNLKAEWRSIRMDLNNCNTERNKYVHAHTWVKRNKKIWGIKYLRELNAKGVFETEQEVTAATLNDLVKKVSATESRLESFIFGNLDAIQSDWHARTEDRMRFLDGAANEILRKALKREK